jgi:hypothetical protein
VIAVEYHGAFVLHDAERRGSPDAGCAGCGTERRGSSLLVLAAVVYVATLGQDGFLGFVNAGAEASMVGAIADWFAVTALFKHPLGLPIPHTALIPKRKDELGRGLEEFVGENFLQEDIIRDRVAAATISRRVGRWLAEPGERARSSTRSPRWPPSRWQGRRRARRVDWSETPWCRASARSRSRRCSAPARRGVRDDLHHGLVDLALEELHGWLVENPETFAEVLGERAPWWAPDRLNELVTDRLHLEAAALARRHPRRPAPPPGRRSTRCWRQLADDLLSTTTHPGAHRAAQGAACSTTRSDRPRRSRSVEALKRRPAGALRTPTAPCASGCDTS